MNPLAFLRVNLAFLKVNLAFPKVNLAFLRVNLAFLRVNLAFLKAQGGRIMKHGVCLFGVTHLDAALLKRRGHPPGP